MRHQLDPPVGQRREDQNMRFVMRQMQAGGGEMLPRRAQHG